MKEKKLNLVITRSLLLLMAAVIFIGSAPSIWGEDQDVILKAMKDELDRSMKSLEIKDMERPYYIEYEIIDFYQWSIDSDFGALIKSEKSRHRILKTDLRVGDYTFDNSGYMDRSNMFSSFMGEYSFVTLEDDYNAIRRSLWLATDQAYKNALKQMAGKKAYLKTQLQDEEIPDFSKEESVKKIAPIKNLEFDQSKWEKTLKKLSGIFRQFPAIHDAGVEMKVRLLNKYYVNSEGTVFRQPETIATLEAKALALASNGSELKNYVPFYAVSLEKLPGDKELEAGIRKMAEELTALVTAPVLDQYIGPVLFTNQAAAELFTQTLVPHLSGQRPPISNMPQIEQMTTSSKLVNRLNRKILPREISISDDPLRSEYDHIPLLGSYVIDDQGVAARPVTLVENGILKTLLMSRRPRKEITQSNGHGRAGLMGYPSVQIGNLLITSNKGKSPQQLKDELIQLCKEQNLEFGLIVKVLDNPSITGGTDSFSFIRQARQGDLEITAPIIIYRIFAGDGREELVQGISITDFSVGDLKNITAVGKDHYTMKRLMGSAGGVMGGIFSLFTSSRQGDIGIPATIVAPSILFEEIEFKKNEGKKEKPPLMSHPFFVK